MHIYELDGGFYPSVTTILKIISTNEDLLKWANHMGFKRKDIKKIQEESTDFGTKVHSHLQSIVDNNFNNPIPYKDNLEKYEIENIKKKFIEFFKDIKYNTLYTEKTIISKELGYAGTLDWLFTLDNDTLILGDFKTSKKVHTTMLLQLGGYYNLLRTLDIHPDIGTIIIANERECSLHPISQPQLEEYGRLFHTLFLFYKMYSETIIKPDYSLIKLIKQPINSLNQ